MTTLAAKLMSAATGWAQIKDVILDSEAPSVTVMWNDGALENDLDFLTFSISSSKLVVTAKTKWNISWTRTYGTANVYFTNAATVSDGTNAKSVSFQVDNYLPMLTIALSTTGAPIVVCLDSFDQRADDGAKKVFVISPYSETTDFRSTSSPKPFIQLYMCVSPAVTRAGLCPVPVIGTDEYTPFVKFISYSNDMTIGKKYINGEEVYSTGLWVCSGTE